MAGLGVGGSDRWRFRFYQMQNGLPGFTTEQFLFDLPLNSATFTSVLQQTGTWNGTLELSDPGVQKILESQPPLHLLTDRTAMYVELNGELVYGGILQQVQYDHGAKQCQLQGQDWWGYFNNCRIISWNSSYTGLDQLAIAADIINIAQGQGSTTFGTGYQSPAITAGYVVGGNVGVKLGSRAQRALIAQELSGIGVTQAWAESSFKPIGQAISDLGTAADGFDWTIDVAYVNGVPTKTFNLWFPRAGRTEQQQNAAGSAVVFDMGSSSGQKYVWMAGATQTANTLFGAGSGAGNTAIASVAANPALLQEGWPLLEDNVSYTDVLTQSLLDNVTLAHLYAVQFPVSQIQVQYNAGAESNQPYGSYSMGDDVRLIIPPDPYFPKGYDSEGIVLGSQWWRVQQIQVSIMDDGKSYQTVTLGVPPTFIGTT